MLRIATAADFCGTRWNVNAVLLGTHPSRVFLMPVGLVMRQYRKYLGSHAVQVTGGEGIDVVASRRDNRLLANLVNTHSDRSVDVELSVVGHPPDDAYLLAELPGSHAHTPPVLATGPPVVDPCRRGGVD